MGPFKCPDCGVWWAGFEHRCSPAMTQNITAPTFGFGHCHACISAVCPSADHVPCSIHRGGYVTV